MINLTLKFMKAAVREHPGRYRIEDRSFLLCHPCSAEFKYHVLYDKLKDCAVAVTKWRQVKTEYH